MDNAVLPEPRYTLDDGLGVRSIQADLPHGIVDVLDVTEVLAAAPIIADAIRARASRYAVIDPALIAPVRRIQREGETLRIASHLPEGVRLSWLLARLESGTDTLADGSLMELAGAVVRAVASLHQLPGLIVHGAITPSHVVVARDGSVILTDAIFGTGIEALQWTRDQLWREFGIAMPASASVHRFDQRSDVTQLGAVVLAIALRRRLQADEYPRAVGDLVMQATPAHGPAHALALRMWLQQAFHLHPRSVLATAADAHQMFTQVLAVCDGRRSALQPVKDLVHRRTMDTAFLGFSGSGAC